MSAMGVDTIAILRVKRKDCKGAMWSKGFSRLAYCRERQGGIQMQGRVRRHVSRVGTRASGLIQTVLRPKCARGETELTGIGSSVTAQSCLPNQPVPHCVCPSGHEQDRQGVWKCFYLVGGSNDHDRSGAGSFRLELKVEVLRTSGNYKRRWVN